MKSIAYTWNQFDESVNFNGEIVMSALDDFYGVLRNAGIHKQILELERKCEFDVVYYTNRFDNLATLEKSARQTDIQTNTVYNLDHEAVCFYCRSITFSTMSMLHRYKDIVMKNPDYNNDMVFNSYLINSGIHKAVIQ
jgi:hypothetical protein